MQILVIVYINRLILILIVKPMDLAITTQPNGFFVVTYDFNALEIVCGKPDAKLPRYRKVVFRIYEEIMAFINNLTYFGFVSGLSLPMLGMNLTSK